MRVETGRPMRLEYAEWLAGHLVEKLDPYLKRVVVGGSIRRKREQVGDIELVCEPYMHGDLFDGGSTPVLDPLRIALAKLGRIVRGRDRHIRAHLAKTDQYVDIFICWPPAQWGSTLAIRTGPADLGKYVMMKCRDERGLLHTRGHAIKMRTGEVLDTSTEEQFFALVGLDCPPPELRDGVCADLWAAERTAAR